MASAMIAGLVKAGRDGASVLVIEPTAAYRQRLEQNLRVRQAPWNKPNWATPLAC